VLDRQRTFAEAVAAWLRAGNDVGAVTAVYSAQSARCMMTTSDVGMLLVDGDLPGSEALTLCSEVSGGERPLRVIMLSVSAEARQILAAIRVGADAWVRKDESAEHLLHVISRVARGETWVPPAELGRVFELLLREQDDASHHVGPIGALTPRERDVLSHVAGGADRKEVAERLHLSVNTVRTHMQSLMAKLGAHSALEAVALARPWLDGASAHTRGA
jgi:DNA-binding NarL/FixJ family response regulator